MNNITIPWTEKYRPTEFEQIVLSDINKQILKRNKLFFKKNHEKLK